MRLRVDESRTLPAYAACVLNAPATKDYFRRVLKQQCGQASLNQGHVRSIPFPLPEVPVQHRIVKYLDHLQAKVNILKAMQTQTTAELDALLPSILDRAFKGEL